MHNLKNDEKGEWIVRAIDDYPRYMRLPKVNFVPPVEVDVIWHTHQLSGIAYRFVPIIYGYVAANCRCRDDCIEHFGVFIGHDDSQPPEVIR